MLLPLASDCRDITSQGDTTSAYIALALSQIATALQTAGTYTCTLTTSGKPAAGVKLVQKMLLDLGYRLTVSSTTITILWDGSAPAVAISY